MVKKISSLWVTGFAIFVVTALVIIASWTIIIDPFFHYHKPNINKYFYILSNQRSQNYGIVKHFDYQGIITGTSMTENFKTSEAEQLWGGTFIKIPFWGASFKEINDSLAVALKYNSEISVIIRSLDMTNFIQDKDAMRLELGSYPTYLYDESLFNDVYYIFNRDVLFSRIYPMIRDKHKSDFHGGITSFDQYSNWMKRNYKFGKKSLYPKGIFPAKKGAPVYLSEQDRSTVLDNVRQNVTALAQMYPDVIFYCFFPPYSAKYWQDLVENGKIYRQIQAEKITIEEVLKYKNIKLFSFNNLTNITTNLNNYRHETHYGEWINSLILKCMYSGKCLLTEDNYEEYLAEELRFYTTFDYAQMDKQEDYEDDYHVASLIITP